MDFTPQVETREISDAELDGISGGLLDDVVSTVTGTVDSVAPVTPVVMGVVGAAQALTGVDAGAVTGAIAGL